MVRHPDPIKTEPKTAIGIDLGLKNEVVTSDGEVFEYPKYYQEYEQKLAAAQKDLSRKEKGSNNRSKARIRVSRIHQKITCLRDDFMHKLSRTLVDKADLIIFEDINIKGLVQNHHLAKAINDSSWSKLILMTVSKAEKAGKAVQMVDARYTSQRCSGCGSIIPKDLSERVHDCPRTEGQSLQRSGPYFETLKASQIYETGSPLPLGRGRESQN